MSRTERLHRLLQVIVESYIQTAKPVGSKTLVQDHGFEYSPATIRNDMALLEQEGYIIQPHTSAGRIPTEKGYQFYIHHFLQQKQLKAAQRKQLDAAAQKRAAYHNALRAVAKAVADATQETVLVSIGDQDYYYTGLSHLMRKPEFTAEQEVMAEIGEVLDGIEDNMQPILEAATDEVQVLVGQDNPLNQSCSVVLTEYRNGGKRSVMGIFGPMRMDYSTNIAILNYMEELMDQLHDRQE